MMLQSIRDLLSDDAHEVCVREEGLCHDSLIEAYSKPPIVDRRQQSLTVSVNARGASYKSPYFRSPRQRGVNDLSSTQLW